MRHFRKAFNLIELMIVVLVISILAMIVIPKFSDASDEARNSSMATELAAIRRQIELYKSQHGGRSPHVKADGASDTSKFLARLIGKTDPDGTLNLNGACGPYIRQWPKNPFVKATNAARIKFGSAQDSPRDNSTGWYFCTANAMLHANSSRGGESINQ
ncbi:MAG: type II secretion system protein [Planctomycetes bacterium]|nr:type II secretion system protein [Planctomycetota bacterium]